MRYHYLFIAAALAAVAIFSHFGVDTSLAAPVALAAVVQTAYSERMPKGAAGLIASMTNYDSVSRIVETEAGIGFGLAVSRGTNPRGIVIGGTLAAFQGALIRDPTLEAGNEDKAQQNSIAGVMRKGEMWVTAGAAVTAGDPVHFNATTGAFLPSGEQGPIVGAEWLDTAASGELARIYLAGNA